MRLKGVRQSSNVQDRRGRSGGGRARAGGIGGLGLLAVLAIGWFAGIDLSPLLNSSGGSVAPVENRPVSAEEERAGDFASRVLATTEVVWGEVFPREVGEAYTPPQLILFSQVTQSACGGASGATGPFYCPVDRSAYLDTAFFAQLSQQMGARGDFAAAYVIAHEVAHHVQNELGILGQARQAQASMSKADANAISVRIELQADCLSGVWASYVDDLLEPGDLEEALNAARKIGDDYLMQQAGRVPNPHSFTHGTSDQRERWFAQGYQKGQIAACDTFSARTL